MSAKLYLYIGPMSSGKTQSLLHAAEILKRQHKKPLLLTPSLDIRNPGEIITRFGDSGGKERSQRFDAKTIDSLSDLSNKDLEGVGAICVDEIWMLGQNEDRDVARVNALLEAKQVQNLLDSGIEVHGSSLNLLANSNMPILLQQLYRLGPEIKNQIAACDTGGCPNDACYTAISGSNGKRLEISQIPAYMPQSSFEGDNKNNVFQALCFDHYWDGFDLY